MNNLLTSARNRAINLARRLRRRPRAKLTRIITLAGRNDLPPNLNPRRVYQLGEPGKWAVMTCPCGRGHVIELNLAHPGRARWSVTADAAGAPSVRPSVDVQSEHRCHFWLQSGRIVWV